MGMYTEFHFNSELKPDTPTEVMDILEFMLKEKNEPPKLPEHEFFKCERWEMLFTCDSAYFDSRMHSQLVKHDILGTTLNIRSNLKNYDQEIQKFISWVTPYLNKHSGEFLGFYRYEESERPTLIYYEAAV
jgi:hypothetical protein